MTALVVVPVTAAIVSSPDEDTPHGSVTASLARDLTVPAASRPERCHGTGALIRRHGHVEQVSIARGLRAYEHRAAGTFLRLCPAATPQDQ